MALSRRSFLRHAATGVALAGAGAAIGRKAFASGGSLTAMLSTGQTYNVLEIFLNGGADLWTHAFRVPSWDDYVTWVSPGLETFTPAQTTTFTNCQAGAVAAWKPTSATESVNFATMGATQVKWGPAFKPLWMSGLAYRTRAVCVRHEFPPHEGAVPLALTGTSLGRPLGSCLGAAVNRTRASGVAPYSFVIPAVNSGIGGHILAAASATGFHGAQHRPPVIACGNDDILTLIRRQDPPVGSTVARADGDTLRSYYDSLYKGMLASPGGRARSRAYDAYEGSLATLHDHLGVQARLGASGLTFVVPGSTNAAANGIATAIRAASKIFDQGARHITVMDTGWDNHHGSVGATPQDYALYNFNKVYQLAHAIAYESVYGTLDLNTTLIYLHSEFGRRHESTAGTAHAPEGYPVFLIGGPVTTAAVVGTFTPPASGSDAASGDDVYGVTAVRAAVALAAGINPWHDDMYTESYPWLGSALQWYPDHGQPLDNGNLAILESDILGI